MVLLIIKLLRRLSTYDYKIEYNLKKGQPNRPPLFSDLP